MPATPRSGPSSSLHPDIAPAGLDEDIASALEELSDSLVVAQAALSRLPLLAEEVFDMTLARIQALTAVGVGEQRVQDVAERTWSSMSATSRTVDALVREGLVDRRSDPEDRRATRLELTPDGRARLEEIDDWRREVITEVYRGLGPVRVREVAASLAALGEQLAPVVEKMRARLRED